MLPGAMPAASDLLVLLVEDDRDLAGVTQQALEHEGVRVAVAYDGREALDLFERLHPQVVVTDLIMPRLDGLELIRRIGQLPQPHAPVIAVSAVGARLRAARDLGAAEVLLKPVDPLDLISSVRKAARAAG
jgi:CheY-like chemotaxis protein